MIDIRTILTNQDCLRRQIKGIDDMAIRPPHELKGIPFSPETGELRGTGVEFWKSWKAKNHFKPVTEQLLRNRKEISVRVLDCIKKELGVNNNNR